MEFIINHETFNQAISEVSKAVSSKTPFPILTGIKIIADTNQLTVIGSNSDIIIEKIIPLEYDGVKVLEVLNRGSVVISAKYLSEIAKKLPNDIHIKGNEKQIITIQSDDIVTTLHGFNSEEYPMLPKMVETPSTRMAIHDLIELIKQTVFATSKNETRPVLTGVHMSFQENKLTCAATNSHRLALSEITIESNVNGSVIIPSSALHELLKLMNPNQGEIEIYISTSYIVFKSSSMTLFSRLIEGNYPNVVGLIPHESETAITMNTKQLLKGIDRACLFASDWKNNNVMLEMKDASKLKISSNSTEIGRIEEYQPILSSVGCNELSISLDGNFLMDALKVIKEEEVKISFGGSMRPVLIEPVNNSSQLQLISPVRTY
ncbi:DNA polymerase III subunit beta [Fredinandcohnia quinoae]|uniref:Beta sliding clamp n=1 Tax=Fredinandcohnia quinoae TaxID=2918902 RepID=A0AAW5E2Z9_9BACI|nr:DNA polymerase III subunit beta [Fredinandcohnia sp. SECRCQ15]MCH1624366.1 DNA polymerase III subunit beta [Fredinandcohnia sp. SECRCQ15]